MSEKSNLFHWKIRISDGFCEYEYLLPAERGDLCINDIYELVRKKLEARKVEPKQIV